MLAKLSAALLKASPALQRLIAHYDQLPERERRLLKWMLVAVVALILYIGVWRPIHGFQQSAAAELESSRDLVAWVFANQSAAQALVQTNGNAQTKITDGRSLLSTVTTSAKENGLALQRFEPSGDTGMRIWLDEVPFNTLASWLEILSQRYGILVDQASIDRGKQPGRVTARLTLQL